MKRQVYSARRLCAKELEKILESLDSSAVVIGVDVAKRELMLMLRCQEGRFVGPYRAVNPDQIPDVVEWVRRVGERGPVQVAMESSGTYGDALRQALSDGGIELRRVESKHSHDYAEVFDGVPSQHDGKDAAVIAELCAIGKSSRWAYELASENDSRMRLLVEWIDSQDRIRRLWLGRLEALLARHWPEATRVMELRSATLLRALAHYHGPGELAADAKAVESLLRWGGTWLRREKAVALVESAKKTLGVRQNAVDRERLGCCARQALEASLQVKGAKPQLRKLAKGNRVIEVQATAVGIATACVLWTRVGDPNDYPVAAAYRKAMGLNLVERSSGQYKGQLRISKRGDPLVRRWLHMAVVRLIGKHAEVRDWYRRKRERSGDRHRCASTALIRRLAIALHRIGVSGEAFEVQRLFAGALPAQSAGGK
jgi:transposase